MKAKIEKQPKSTLKIIVTVENDKVKETYEEILESAVKNTAVEGFRKGTAPKKMVEEKVGISTLHGDLINALLQKYYPQALKENSVSPVSNPKVEIKEFDIEKDFEFVATVATMPTIKIGNYEKSLKEAFEKKIKEAKKELEKSKDKKEDGKAEEPHVHMIPNEVVDTLIATAKVEIADLLIEEETERLMQQLMQHIQAIGLPLDQYLKSQNKKADELRTDYEKIAENNIKAEFVLSELIKERKIEVSDEEINAMIQAAGDPQTQAAMQDPMQKLYIKTILQKNKLIGDLLKIAEGEHHHEHK